MFLRCVSAAQGEAMFKIERRRKKEKKQCEKSLALSQKVKVLHSTPAAECSKFNNLQRDISQDIWSTDCTQVATKEILRAARLNGAQIAGAQDQGEERGNATATCPRDRFITNRSILVCIASQAAT